MVEVKTKVGSKSLGDVESLEDMVELQVGITEVEAWTWQTRAETVGEKTMVEPEGRRSPAEPEG